MIHAVSVTGLSVVTVSVVDVLAVSLEHPAKTVLKTKVSEAAAVIVFFWIDMWRTPSDIVEIGSGK
jgi:hypothetical protein